MDDRQLGRFAAYGEARTQSPRTDEVLGAKQADLLPVGPEDEQSAPQRPAAPLLGGKELGREVDLDVCTTEAVDAIACELGSPGWRLRPVLQRAGIDGIGMGHEE
jgi:hypothetical protein